MRAGGGRRLVPFGLVLGHHRHKGLIEGTIGKQAPQIIGDAIGKEEYVSRGSRPQQMSDDNIPHQAENSGGQRRGGDQ